MKTCRNTIQKKLVYEALVRLANHPTAEEVFLEAQHMRASISRATVYRILNQLAEQHAILRVPVSDGADHFDQTVRPHYHLKCSSCGRVLDMAPAVESDIRIAVPDTAEYTVTGYTILFRGICQACREKRQQGPEGLAIHKRAILKEDDHEFEGNQDGSKFAGSVRGRVAGA